MQLQVYEFNAIRANVNSSCLKMSPQIFWVPGVVYANCNPRIAELAFRSIQESEERAMISEFTDQDKFLSEIEQRRACKRICSVLYCCSLMDFGMLDLLMIGEILAHAHWTELFKLTLPKTSKWTNLSPATYWLTKSKLRFWTRSGFKSSKWEVKAYEFWFVFRHIPWLA